MQLRDVRRLWEGSRDLVGGGRAYRLVRRVHFTTDAWRKRRDLQPLLEARSEGLLGRTLAARPVILGFAHAPYLNKNWTAAERIRAFADDVNTAEQLPLLAFDLDQQIDLMTLDHIGPGFWLVIDKPIWFHREGIATLNLFRDETRLFTIAFSVREIDGILTATIGGIQGRNIDGMLDLYREITKTSAGLRPRDLLLEMFKVICADLGVRRLLAVTDGARHHRSTFFGAAPQNLSLDYDAIWLDRGGERINDDFFALPLDRQDRDADEIPSKKRALYAKRYTLLDELTQRLHAAVASASPRPFHREG